jgi:GNAT superfamily N-acetyltransferase
VFGILHQGTQIAMARVVTDYRTFAWICDVVVMQKFQGLGFGRWLMDSIEVHPALAKVRRYLLCTRTAKGLYAKLGYEELPNNETTWMIRMFPDREEKQLEKMEMRS